MIFILFMVQKTHPLLSDMDPKVVCTRMRIYEHRQRVGDSVNVEIELYLNEHGGSLFKCSSVTIRVVSIDKVNSVIGVSS